MKLKCRILSIFVISILAMMLVVCIIKIVSKSKSQNVYADTISFTPTAGSIEIYKGNALFIDNNMVSITPSSCTYLPKFTIRGYGEDKEQAEVIDIKKLSFSNSGKYILTCRIPSSEKYFAEDSLIINVVETPTEYTTLYGNKLAHHILYVEDTIALTSLIDIKFPKLGNMYTKCSEHISIENKIVTALKDGIGMIEVFITYDNITVYEVFSVSVKPKLLESDINLILCQKGEIVANNIIEVSYSTVSFSVDYELINLDGNQEINCWTNDDIVQVISFNSPIIILKTLNVGETIVYVSPKAYPDLMFEILIIIN